MSEFGFKAGLQSDHHVSAHGKCILAGEHTVLRGGSALVFPVEKYIRIRFSVGVSSLRVRASGHSAAVVEEAFMVLAQHALPLLKHKVQSLFLDVFVENAIPIGRGLGFSAALCVAFARMCVVLGWLNKPDIYAFAKRCEDCFHGKSSGVDIHGVLSERGVFVAGNGEIFPVHSEWKPYIYLVDTGCVGMTAAAVSKVMALQSEPWAFAVDQAMQNSVLSMQNALQSPSCPHSALADSMRLGQSCFVRWGLVPSSVEVVIEKLRLQGAEAVKLTGSGGGGFLLALFIHKQAEAVQREGWLPLFATDNSH